METHYYGGIDFSGAKEPLSNLWSAVGHEREGKLHVVTLCPHPFRKDLAHHVAGGWRKPAGAPEEAPILWGADFPFGIPRAALAVLGADRGEAGWTELLAWAADRPADEVRAAFPDHQKTPRTTDTGTAMAPFDADRMAEIIVVGAKFEVREGRTLVGSGHVLRALTPQD